MQDDSVPPRYFRRHARQKVARALAYSRIVAIVGPRQAGKTTLVRQIAQAQQLPYRTLDDIQSRRLARSDPAGFIRRLPTGVIDEIQQAPDLVLEMKRTVDEDSRPGRYLITGSVDLFRSAMSPDSLAGRLATVELLPLAAAEIAEREAPRFLERAFAGDFPGSLKTGTTDDLWQRIATGGFPAAIAIDDPEVRADWLRDYADALARHDIPQAARINDRGSLLALLKLAAAVNGRLVDLAKLARSIRVDGKTVDRWLRLMEAMFLIRRVPAWHGNALRRLVKSPRLYFLDSALAAAVTHTSAARLERDRSGAALECFVHGEISKAVAGQGSRIVISHFRDKNRNEVDLVLEQPAAGIVGIEVTAAAAVGPSDFRGLRELQRAAGDDFACGIILHDGDRIENVARQMFAMPIKMLWEA